LWAGLPDRAYCLDPSLFLPQFIHTTWNETAGSAIPGVWALAQTIDGYLWLGTEQGLIQFDGLRFVPWKPRAGEDLPGTRIISLASSAKGGLWIGMQGAILRLRDGRLQRYTARDGVPAAPVVTMVEDQAGRLWAGCAATEGDGLIRIENGSLRTFGQNQGLPASSVSSLFSDRDGSLWAGMPGALCRITDKGAEECRHSPLPDHIASIASGAVDATLLAGTIRGILHFGGGNSQPFALDTERAVKAVKVLLRDRDSVLWAGSLEQGLFRLRNGRVEHFNRQNGLSSDVIHALLEDREGNLWVGTPNGLDRFREPKVARWSTEQGLAGNLIIAIGKAHDGGLWIGSLRGGLDRLRGDSIEPFRAKAGWDNGTVLALQEDSRGTLWAATSKQFGYFSQNQFTEIRPPNGKPFTRIFLITEGPPGNLWLADQEQGLHRIRNGRIEPFTADGLDPAKMMYQLLCDHAGNLWIGYYSGGLTVVRDGKVQSYDAQSGLAPGPVLALYQDRSETIWVGTNEGLSRFRKGHWTTWTSRQGLPAGGVQAIIEDKQGHLWLVTGAGVLGADKTDLDRQRDAAARPLSFSTYGASDGIYLNGNAATMSQRVAITGDGRLWVGTGDGLASINAPRMRNNGLPPPVAIEQLTVDGKPLEISAGEMGLRGHSVAFEYTALSLTRPEAVRFRYRLDGLDQDWIDAGSRRQTAYANLPPRRYRFRVIACNNDGVWNTTGVTLAFRREPYFYETWLFVALCAGVLGLMAYLAYAYRVRQLRLRFRLVLDERARLARELHDTLLQGFTGVVFQLEAASRQLIGSPEAGRRRIDLALEQADQSLKDARLALSAMRMSTLENTTLPEAIAAAARQVVDGTSIHFHMEVRGTVRTLPYEVQFNLFVIAREAITNAMNHAKPDQITLEAAYAEDQIRLTVQDDGIGFNAQTITPKEGHLGLTGMRERAMKIGAALRLESAPGRGTRVEVVVASKRSRD